MAEQFEVIDLKAVEELKIFVDQGPDRLDPESLSSTDIYIAPPISADERAAIVERVGAESKLGELLVAGFREQVGLWVQLAANAQSIEEHAELGIELAKQIIALKGLRGARVAVSVAGGSMKSYLVMPETPDAPEREARR